MVIGTGKKVKEEAAGEIGLVEILVGGGGDAGSLIGVWLVG